MFTNKKYLLRVGLAVVFLVGAVLACGPVTGGKAVTVVINSPVNGASVAVGHEVLVDSTTSASAGVSRVELSVGGAVLRHDVPPTGNPTTFRISQPWTPTAEGQVTISVVGYDVDGNSSDAATIMLQVVSSGGAIPTDGPGTMVPPGPTETAPPPVTTEAGCTLGSQYIADVTIPDGTILSPGAGFGKTWKVKNTGTCDWDASYHLVFVSGDQMSGPPSVALPSVPAGTQADISVNLVAPTSYGTHKGTWRIRSDEGTVFGTNLTVLIEVPDPATATPIPTDVPTSLPTLTPFGGGGGRIAYVSFRDGNAEIYVMGEDDISPTRLTNNPELDDWPAWSPDGSKIAFTRYSAGKPDIFVMNADGSGQANLTNNAHTDSRPSWSPDGSKIVFTSNRVGGVLQIWVMNADGSGATQLTDTPKLNSSPHWSPDGSRIAFESMRDNQREIYVMNADGSGQTRLTFTGGNYGPKWAPFGNRLVFSTSDGIWKMKGDGTNLVQLTTSVGPTVLDMHPCWSPDGTRIVFDSKRDGNSDLWVVRPDGSGLQKLTTNSAHDLNPAWR